MYTKTVKRGKHVVNLGQRDSTESRREFFRCGGRHVGCNFLLTISTSRKCSCHVFVSFFIVTETALSIDHIRREEQKKRSDMLVRK